MKDIFTTNSFAGVANECQITDPPVDLSDVSPEDFEDYEGREILIPDGVKIQTGAEMQIKFSQPIPKKHSASDRKKTGFDLTKLMQQKVENLTEEEVFVRSGIIRKQERLKETGARNDPADRPGRSGGYQTESGR